MKVHETTVLDARTSRAVRLTRMGFGGAPLGNLYRRVSEEDAQAALRAAHACGVRYFDTAPLYGLGRSEERLGIAVKRFGRENIVLSSKVGRLLVDCSAGEVTPTPFVDVAHRKVVFDYTYDGVMRSLASSLRRLGVDDIDIVLVHDVDVFTHRTRARSDAKVRELFDGGGYRALQELKAGGRIAAFGAGVNEWQVCERLLELGEFDVFLLAGRYTLLEQEALDTFLPLCVARDVGIILGGPFNSGILATGAVGDAMYNYDTAPPAIMERVRKLEAVCMDHGVRLPAAALAFVLAHPAVRSVIPGALSEREVRQNAALLDEPIPPGLWTDLKGARLLHEEAPVPGA
ncbi:MAG: aldo/keto reductase [Thiotrichales bacterium]|nr:aldo/keto reductase [Thiotrichales bacterium]